MQAFIKLPFRFFLRLFFYLLVSYFILCYFVLPGFWNHYEHRPELEAFSKTSFTREGLPGDPLNVAFFATDKELVSAMMLAGWAPADPLKVTADLRLAEDVLMKKSYPRAPVSSLYLLGRKQDAAFEKEVDGYPSHRHHVRFWKTEIGASRPLWIGSATYDKKVGLSHYTGQFTHHIDADIDKERNELAANLVAAGQLKEIYQVTGVGPTLSAYNGSRDRYFTDGELTVGVISNENKPLAEPPVKLSSPAVIEIKNGFWDFVRGVRKLAKTFNADEDRR